MTIAQFKTRNLLESIRNILLQATGKTDASLFRVIDVREGSVIVEALVLESSGIVSDPNEISESNC